MNASGNTQPETFDVSQAITTISSLYAKPLKEHARMVTCNEADCEYVLNNILDRLERRPPREQTPPVMDDTLKLSPTTVWSAAQVRYSFMAVLAII